MTHYNSQPPMQISARGKELRQRILQNHLSYLGQEETPAKLEQRRNLEGLIAEFLSLVPHSQKFMHTEITDILSRSVLNIPDFSAYKAGAAFQALEKYAANLLGHPWRKEYRVIRVYGGFFSHSVRNHLVESERVLHLMGYAPHSDGILTLEGPVDPDRVTRVSLDCIVAYVECQIMVQIGEKLESFKWQDIYQVRQSYTCGQDEAVRILQQLQQEKQVHERKSQQPAAKLKDIYNQHFESNSHPVIAKDSASEVIQPYAIQSPSDDIWPMVWKSPTSPVATPRYSSSQPDGYSVRLAPISHPASTRASYTNGTSCLPTVNGSQNMSRLIGEDPYENQRSGGYPPTLERPQQMHGGFKPPPPLLNSKESSWDPLQDAYFQQDLMTDAPPQSIYGCMPRGALAYHPYHPIGHQYPPFHCYENPLGYIMPFKPDPLLHLPSSPCHCCHLQPLVPSMHCTRLDTGTTATPCTYPPNREQNLNTLADLHASLQHVSLLDSKGPSRGEQDRTLDDVPLTPVTQNKQDRTRSSGQHKNNANGIGIVQRRTGERSSRRSSQVRRGSYYDNLSSSSPEDDRIESYYSVPNENVAISKNDFGDIDTQVPYSNSLARRKSASRKNASDVQPAPEKKETNPVSETPSASIGKTGHVTKSDRPEEPKSEPPAIPPQRVEDVPRAEEKSSTIYTDGIEPQPKEGGDWKGKWSCSTCTYLNDEGTEICEMCSKSRRRGSECTPLVSGGRECPRCTFVNVKETEQCSVCDASLKDCPTYI